MIRFSYTLLLLVLVLTQACSSSNQKKQSQQPSAANPLAQIVGDWTVSTRIHAIEQGEEWSFPGTDTCAWIGSSATLACTYRSTDNKFAGFTIRSWDSSTGNITGYWMDSGNPYGPLQFTGTYDANTQTIKGTDTGKDETGKPLKTQVVRTFPTKETSVITVHRFAADGSKTLTATYTLKKIAK